MADNKKNDIHLALIHYPVFNKIGEIVTSSVTTLDVHDISRAARTYAVNSFYVVTPLKTQRQLVERLIEHWMTGYGAEYNPTRKEALLATRVTNNIKETVRDLTERCGRKPVTVATVTGFCPHRSARSCTVSLIFFVTRVASKASLRVGLYSAP